MTQYDWQTIFKNKDENELVKIYSGNSTLNFEAEIYAGLELKNRNYDFKKIEQVHKRKTEELKNEIYEFETLDFIHSKYFKELIYNVIGFIALIILLIMEYKNLESIGVYNYYQIIFYIILFSIMIVSAKWKYNLFIKNKEKTIKEKTELLNKITTFKK